MLYNMLYTEVGSASHKSCTASARATTPKKIIVLQAQVWRFEMHNSNWLTAQTSLGYGQNQYSKQIMHATKLVNKKLLISF